MPATAGAGVQQSSSVRGALGAGAERSQRTWSIP